MHKSIFILLGSTSLLGCSSIETTDDTPSINDTVFCW